MSTLPSQLEIAAERRQRILDFLNRNPGARMDRIGGHLRRLGDHGNAHNTIRTMAEWGEIRFEGSPRTRRYYAIAGITRSADESREMRIRNVAEANEKRHQAKVVESLSCKGVVHHPGKHPIPGQGGQGAVRQRVSINCSQLW